ncbi:HAD family phosphatase [Mucilaginibacter sp. AK015]|uniref:HAD family hydrolase n=1 Tax=Mucilaginibacter sp. AK015 TaxID=2723072 RepID=UPI0016173D5F|nr:HAD family phosphatase [Mucilaginibacter sp. AK015]MBB5396520.1 HAD superfamily hydrolase (TIGR01509 family) [Mucilaginibacter sp. AK015]
MDKTLSAQKYKALTKLAAGDYQAFLYDCDGTLADNMGAHKNSYIRVAADDGVVIDGDIIDEFAGLPILNVVDEINKRYNTTFEPADFAARKHKIFFNEYIEQTQPIEYVVNHLKSHAGKVKIGVVSGGSRNSVTKTLQVLGIYDLVEVLICAGETERGKPFADPFLAAAEQLGVEPRHCLVFEDGEPGVQAAEAAGMQWIRIDKV